MQIDWKSKLSSRKFWVSIIGFITPLLVAFGFSENQITEISAIIMAGAQLITYVISESVVDTHRMSVTNNCTSSIQNSIQSNTCSDEEDIII